MFAVSATCAFDVALDRTTAESNGTLAVRHDVGPCGEHVDIDEPPSNVIYLRNAAPSRPVIYRRGLLESLDDWTLVADVDPSAAVPVRASPVTPFRDLISGRSSSCKQRASMTRAVASSSSRQPCPRPTSRRRWPLSRREPVS
jgi:hypothetical protein